MLSEESDEDMKEMLKEELANARKNVETLEEGDAESTLTDEDTGLGRKTRNDVCKRGRCLDVGDEYEEHEQQHDHCYQCVNCNWIHNGMILFRLNTFKDFFYQCINGVLILRVHFLCVAVGNDHTAGHSTMAKQRSHAGEG